ncbi:MAG: diphthine--ammonia ligase [Nanoarchaeota archaeon]|nr:diphthine--ammonia ligase [Nanoarchaeota archaeon]MBU0963367.1 diphthine--ammonia ligase [Nanoarchaeota archaeon]
MKLGVLFTGGKDSLLALYKKKDEVVCLLTMISENIDSYMFHTSSIEITKLQAESLNLPLVLGKTTGEKEKELIDLKELIKKAIKEYKIDGLVTGALFSEYQSSRIDNICKELGIKCINPLWHMDPEDELNELIKNKFEFILTSIAADGLDKSWMNKIITEKEVIKLKELNKKYGINMIFEGGEAETLVLNCPLFKKRIKIIDYEIKMESENCGKLLIKKAELV